MKEAFSRALLDWFDREARELPWRLPGPGGLRRDPYQVVVSEIMLQQTQVSAVIPYFKRFMQAFPDFAALAAAPEVEVLKYWEGLGYYRRARMLHKLALCLMEDYGGQLPRDKKVLLKLPGVGPYTAGALLSFAFDLPEAAVDGNLVRVFARLDAIAFVQGDVKAQREVRERVTGLIPDVRAGDFSESLIELGATVCLPKTPLCGACPVRDWCRAHTLSRTGDFPLPAKQADRPVSRLTYLLLEEDGQIYCQRRPEGLLAGLYEFLALPDKAGPRSKKKALTLFEKEYPKLAGHDADWTWLGEGRTVFSHRVWEFAVWSVKLKAGTLLLEDEGGDANDPAAFSAGELAGLPFPAFLIPWRDGWIQDRLTPDF